MRRKATAKVEETGDHRKGYLVIRRHDNDET
jgi:hypothetical protein